jgi:hypothetical protein
MRRRRPASFPRARSLAHCPDVVLADAESTEDRGVERNAIGVVHGDAYGNTGGLP